jgi:hypothetical protein
LSTRSVARPAALTEPRVKGTPKVTSRCEPAVTFSIG